MHLVEFLGTAVKDGHQIDDRVHVLHQALKDLGVGDVGLHHIDHGQGLDAASGDATCGGQDVEVGAVQGFAQVVADKAAGPQNQ